MTFLLDKNSPTKIILLKSSAEKTFAPNFFTGIGGKIGDLPGLEEETVLGSAYRELKEETKDYLTKENTQLREFARCIYNSGLSLYYFMAYILQRLLRILIRKTGLWFGSRQVIY